MRNTVQPNIGHWASHLPPFHRTEKTAFKLKQRQRHQASGQEEEHRSFPFSARLQLQIPTYPSFSSLQFTCSLAISTSQIASLNPMDLLRSNLSRVRIPEPTNRIYKQECCITFDTPRSEGGLFVDMTTFLAFGKDCVDWNYQKTGNPVYLNIKQTKKLVAEDRPLKKPTLLAIGVEGGFDNNEPEYEETYSIVILPDYVTFSFPSVELPEKVRLAVDAILMAEGAKHKEQLASWTADKKKVSAYATDLQQLLLTWKPQMFFLIQTIKIDMAVIPLMFLLLSFLMHSKADHPPGFDVRHHLSTVTRYDFVKDVVDSSSLSYNAPDACRPIHLNLVARHGTRSPTKKRMKELYKLASHLKELIREAGQHNFSLEKIPAWLQDWRSPWRGKLKGGELIMKGEEELYHLGIRIRERFPELFEEPYHPDIYPIRATQVPRTSASAVAFGMGLLSDKGSLGPGHHRAFGVTTESRASDIILRFHDCCENYKIFRKKQEPAVDKLKEPVLDEITYALVSRYGLKFTRQDIASLWFLCKQEAAVLDVTDQACGLFNSSEVALLEWTDDLELFILKGYGNYLNYRMGVPLLDDVVQSMEQAVKAQEEKYAPGSYEKARLRFAHAETVVPFTCLLGLFLEGAEFRQIQLEKPLEPPPKPPKSRHWRGNIVAPFAGNNMLVLYSCPANSSDKYFVKVFHNEHPVPMPGCNNSDFCPFEVFKERIATPHLKHDYNAVCTVTEQPEKSTLTSKLWLFFRWLFPLGNDARPANVEL